jgi:hypothetical protein
MTLRKTPHAWAVFGLVALAIAANAVALSGFFDDNSAEPYTGLITDLQAGWLPGDFSWLDPSAGLITQPVGHLAAWDWLHGIVPWWNPFSGLGMPLAAEGQASALFLPFVLVLLDAHDGWLLLRTMLQAGCGLAMYALLTELRLTRAAAFTGAGLYLLSPFFILCPCAPIAPLPFLPLLMLGITRSARTPPGPAGWVLTAIALAYSIYAGNPEMAYFDGSLAACLALWQAAQLRGWAARRMFGLRIGLGLAAGLALSAPMSVPFLAYVGESMIGKHAGFFTSQPTPAPVFALQVWPFLYGWMQSLPAQFLPAIDYNRLPGWIDAPVLLLALAALRRRAHGLVWVLAGFVALWEARYLAFPPVTWLFNHIPCMVDVDSTRYSGAAVDGALFMLAGFGLDGWQRGGPRRVGLAASALVLLIAAACMPAAGIIGQVWRAAPQNAGYALGYAGLAAGLSAALLFVLAGQMRRVRTACLLVLALPAAGFVLPQLAGFRHARFDLAPIQFLQTHGGDARMTSLGVLDGNFPVQYGIASLNYDSLPVSALMAAYEDQALSPGISRGQPSLYYFYFGATPGQRAALLANLATYEASGVRYVVTAAADESFGAASHARPVFRDDLAAIFELPHPADYARAPHCSLISHSRQYFTTLCTAASTLTRLELYDSGWSARINGRVMPVTQDGVFQSVPLPAGQAKVNFSYAPPHIRAACAAAAAAAAAIATALLRFSRRRRRALPAG